MSKIYKAAMIVIGNEILSGRTQDENVSYVARKMVEHGVVLSEVRIIPDIEDVIVDAIHGLRNRVDYIFTSGGIGPTHDDITAKSVAKALDLPLKTNRKAYRIMRDHYGKDEFTYSHQKMVKMPRGARLIPNPVSVAPGFSIRNIYVMAGVPSILQAMVDYVAVDLKGGAVIQSRVVPCRFAENLIAQELGEIQNKFPSVDIGSYPHFKDGDLGVNIVLRSSEELALSRAMMDIEIMISALEEQIEL